MKLPVKIILINFVLAILFAVTYVITQNVTSEISIVVGLVFLVGGLIGLVVGLFLLVAEDKRYAQGFLMSGGLLLLLGFLTCSSAMGAFT
jgi:uncharacterized membrane protein YagU involved in acid resistance